jgi:tetratricopeptide (TPR) repeat protein
MDKLSLVYEFNKESPLITYIACKELEAKNFETAIELFSTAIEKFPNHAITYFLYSLALAHNNKFAKAKEMITKGDSLLKNKSTSDYYLDKITKIKLESEGIVMGFDDTVSNLLNEAFNENKEFDSDEDEFDLLNDNDIINSDSAAEPIVTETLAEIYASQGNYEEAIEIYNKLKIIKPQQHQKIETRIAELNVSLENKKQKKFGNS